MHTLPSSSTALSSSSTLNWTHTKNADSPSTSSLCCCEFSGCTMQRNKKKCILNFRHFCRQCVRARFDALFGPTLTCLPSTRLSCPTQPKHTQSHHVSSDFGVRIRFRRFRFGVVATEHFSYIYEVYILFLEVLYPSRFWENSMQFKGRQEHRATDSEASVPRCNWFLAAALEIGEMHYGWARKIDGVSSDLRDL